MITSEYLSASAGSGKTFALSTRYCHLVMSKEKPEEICALTFTRPATREIFSAIVERLLDDEHVIEPVPNGLTREQALQRILEALPRLQISTIDSFSSKIARLFAYEIGLNPDFALYDGDRSAEAKQLLYDSVKRALTDINPAAQDELLARYNVQYENAAEVRSLSEKLRNFLSIFESVLEANPRGWGDLKALGCANVTVNPEIESVFQSLQEVLSEGELPKKDVNALQTRLKRYHPEEHSVRRIKQLCGDKFNEYLQDLLTYVHKGCVSDKPFSAPLRNYLEALMTDITNRDLLQTARHTKFLYEALVLLVDTKMALSDERGLLSFNELTKKLASFVGNRLSVCNLAAIYVAYRMDAAIRHLMIDEFQDTSTAQWQILSGMAHELASSDNGTFFYVGDVKQSIYGWRGGDATLFGDPKRLPPIPEGAPLLVSYRSCPTIIRLVNERMRFNFSLGADGKPPKTWQMVVADAWRRQWKDHTPAEKRMGEAGFAQMWCLPGVKQQWRETVARKIAERWHQLSEQPLKIAVLSNAKKVFTDEFGLLNLLRSKGIPCALEGKRAIADTPLGGLVIQLLHWLSDPRATLWEAVTRQLGLIKQSDVETLEAWSRCVNQHGFVAWLESLFGVKAAFRERLTTSDLSVLNTICKGLEPLDRQRCVDPSVAYKTLLHLEEVCIADRNVVNLMTIHQSKGLTYDVVFTILAGDIVRKQNTQYESGDGWVMEPPILEVTYTAVPALQAAREREYQSRMQDTLCALYVAITRAKREQIIFAPESSAKTLKSFAGWLYSDVMSPIASSVDKEKDAENNQQDEDPQPYVVWEEGTQDWWQTLPKSEKESSSQKPEDASATDEADAQDQTVLLSQATEWEGVPVVPTVEVELPSENLKVNSVAELLADNATDKCDFGISYHDKLAQIEWSDVPVDNIPLEVFQRPAELCEVWRERPFSVALQEAPVLRYIPGQFDRVHIFPESRRAVIYDFKTGYGTEVTEAYARQLNNYRLALAKLLNYDLRAIEAKLVFTRYGILKEVGA